MALIGAFLNDKMSPSIRKGVLSILCIYIILIIGFRYKVGVDTISYMLSYKNIPPLDSITEKSFTATRFEPGFLLICSLCKSFTNDFWPVQMIMAAITNGCIFVFLHRYCKNVFIGLLLYFAFQFLYFSTEIMREGASLSIFLLNYKNLQEKKWVNYYLISILSVLFHYSAVIIWFFPFAKILKLNSYYCVICACVIGITPLVESLNNILHIASIYNRIELYTNAADELNINWRIAELIRTAFPAIATIIGYRIIKSKIEFSEMLLLQILLCMGAFAIPLIFSRFTNYTTMFVTVAAANLISSKSLQTRLKILFISFLILTQANNFYNNYNRWFPYVSIFYKEDLPIRQKIYRHFFMPWLKNARGWQ